MSIGPSDRSEEAHPSMTIDRHQTENNMKKLQDVLTSYTEDPDPMEQVMNVTTMGITMTLHTRGL